MLFISTLRGKLGVVALASCIILVVKGLAGGFALGEVFASTWSIMLLLFIVGFSFLLPDILYLMNGPGQAWANWGTSRQDLKREQYGNYSFIVFSPKTKYAVGADDKGLRVATTLLRCSCRDFRKKKRPCVHMHRLAEMLSVHEG